MPIPPTCIICISRESLHNTIPACISPLVALVFVKDIFQWCNWSLGCHGSYLCQFSCNIATRQSEVGAFCALRAHSVCSPVCASLQTTSKKLAKVKHLSLQVWICFLPLAAGSLRTCQGSLKNKCSTGRWGKKKDKPRWDSAHTGEKKKLNVCRS